MTGAAIDEQVGRFHVLARLGAGGMAEVLLAREEQGQSERVLVLKRLLPHLQDEQEQVQMLVDEASLAKHIHHPNVIRTFGFELVGGLPVLLMEYLEGESASLIFKAQIDDGRTDPWMAAYIAKETAKGLHAAHVALDDEGQPLGVVHRDVSPHNVLVTYDGEVKLLDFGVARAEGRDTKTQSGVIKGKPGYIAPEQLVGPSVDRRADVFALGIVLWELSTGERLFQRAHQLAVVQAVCHGEIPAPSSRVPGYPAELERIVMRALDRDRDARYQSAEEMQRDLEIALGHNGWDVDPKERLATYMCKRFLQRREQKVALLQRERLIDTQEIELDAVDSPAPRTFSRWALGAALAVAAVAAAAGSFLLAPANATGTRTPPPPPASTREPAPPEPEPVVTSVASPAAPPPEVRISVTGPSGGLASLGGRSCTTPCELTLPRSEAPAELIVEASGYRAFRTTVTPNRDQQVAPVLRRRAPPKAAASESASRMFQAFD